MGASEHLIPADFKIKPLAVFTLSNIYLQAAASAAELQILIISNRFYDFTDFRCFQIIFINCDAILWFCVLKIEADILVRRDGCGSAVRRPRFLSKTHFFQFSNPSFGWKVTSRHFCQKLNFYRGFMGNRLGQNDRNDRGIISDFYEKLK